MMKRLLHVASVFGLCLCLTLAGCGQKKAASGEEAVSNARAMETTQEKVDYLVKQAEAFYKSEQYKDAVESARYVLKNLEKDSEEAKEIIAKAQKELGSVVEGAIKDMKKGLKDLGK